ncbi:hypothetical protein LTR12_016960 [Friedmanniomyces endolithicus]|nr:hypothetical protein LTR12_016960 [Friedmanniomyces endolithicus]
MRKRVREETNVAARADDDRLKADNTLWVRETRWAEFAGRDLRKIAVFGEKPRAEAGSFNIEWDSVGRVLGRCEDSVSAWQSDKKDGDLVLGWLNSPQMEKFNPQPFSVYYRARRIPGTPVLEPALAAND